jgi:hypothetical protein
VPGGVIAGPGETIGPSSRSYVRQLCAKPGSASSAELRAGWCAGPSWPLPDSASLLRRSRPGNVSSRDHVRYTSTGGTMVMSKWPNNGESPDRQILKRRWGGMRQNVS